jgi:hypothetical protein
MCNLVSKLVKTECREGKCNNRSAYVGNSQLSGVDNFNLVTNEDRTSFVICDVCLATRSKVHKISDQPQPIPAGQTETEITKLEECDDPFECPLSVFE